MTVTIDGNLGITTPSLTATVITVDYLSTLNGVTLQSGANPTITLLPGANLANWTLTFPTGPGAAGQYLTTDGTGVASWTSLGISGTVNPGTINQLTYYAATGDTVSGASSASISLGTLTLGNVGSVPGQLVLTGSNSGAVSVEVAANAGTWSLTLPDNDGLNGQVLTTDGNGVTSWTASSGSGTVNLGTANQMAYYSSTGIVVDGNANVTVNAGELTLGVIGADAGSLVLSGATSGSVTIATNAVAGGWILTLPSYDGNNGQALITDGSGNTSWGDVGSGTVNSGTANHLAYYSASSNAVSSNPEAQMSAGALTLGTAGATAGSLVLSGSTSGTITLNTPAAAGSWSLTLPDNDGSSGQFLTTNGSGVTSWTTFTTALVSGTTAITGGSSGHILYDNAGVLNEKGISGTGDVVLATAPTITGLNETEDGVGTGAITINCATGNVFSTNLTANITSITFSNVPSSGTAYSFTFSVTIGGAFTITWPASVKWPGGVAPTLTSTVGKVDTFVLYTFDAGTTWYAFTSGQNS